MAAYTSDLSTWDVGPGRKEFKVILSDFLYTRPRKYRGEGERETGKMVRRGVETLQRVTELGKVKVERAQHFGVCIALLEELSSHHMVQNYKYPHSGEFNTLFCLHRNSHICGWRACAHTHAYVKIDISFFN